MNPQSRKKELILGLGVLAIAQAALIATLLLELSNKPLSSIKEMDQDVGVIKSVKRLRKRNCRSQLVLSLVDGREKKFYFCAKMDEMYEHLVGKQVTVWSRRDRSIFGPRTRSYLIKHNESVVNQNLLWTKESYDNLARIVRPWIRFLAAFLVITLVPIAWLMLVPPLTTPFRNS
jgi:hypothetical protein